MAPAGWLRIAVPFALAGLLGCRQIAGISDSPQENLTSTTCGLPYGSSACASCASASCCSESSACEADPACAAYEGCLGGCSGNPKCRAQCTIDNPGAVSKAVSELSACLARECEGACGLTCGAMAEYFTPPDASAPCDKCFQSSCDTTRACASSVDCDEFTRCMVACPTPDCREACADAHDAGAALFAPVEQAYTSTCSNLCAYGQNWNCVGHVVWPHAKATTITINDTIRDFSTGLPAPGLDVCWSYDPTTCGDPGVVFAAARTNDAGYSTATLQLPSISSLGGIEPSFQGWCRMSSPETVTVWALMGFPQTERTWTVSPSYAQLSSTSDEFEALLAATGMTPDPSRAVISTRVYDCLGNPAPNVQVSIDPLVVDSRTAVIYGGSAGPLSLGDAGLAATDSTGIAYFVNVLAPDAGKLIVPATATPLGLGVVSSRELPFVQAGVNTQVEMPPTP